MSTNFQYMEVVKVVSEFVTPKKGWRLKNEIGFVLGWSDPDEDGRRDYGVFFNSFGEMIGVPEVNLKSLGRIAETHEIVRRKRGRPRGRQDGNEATEQPVE